MSTSSRNVIEWELCVGCCCCEIACSFHHTRSFQPTHSSIQVHRDEKKKDIAIIVLPTCDLCQGEEELLCVRFCPRDVLSRDLIASLRAQKKSVVIPGYPFIFAYDCQQTHEQGE